MDDLGDAFEHVGQVLTPYMIQLAEFIKEAALAFQALSPETKTFIVAMAAVVTVIGPALAGLGLMVQGIGGLATGLSAIMGVLAKFKVAPWWDPVWIRDERIDDPDTVLEARTAAVHRR